MKSKTWAERLKWRPEAGPVIGQMRLIALLRSRWQKGKGLTWSQVTGWMGICYTSKSSWLMGLIDGWFQFKKILLTQSVNCKFHSLAWNLYIASYFWAGELESLLSPWMCLLNAKVEFFGLVSSKGTDSRFWTLWISTGSGHLAVGLFPALPKSCESAQLDKIFSLSQHKQMLRFLLVILVRTQVPKCNQGKMKRVVVASNMKNKHSVNIPQV